MRKILVTPRSVTKNGHPALKALEAAGHEVVFCAPGKQPDEAELLALLPTCAGYLAGVEKVTRKVLAAAPQLKVIARNGTGIDNVDLDAAKEFGIKVCRAEGANARGVAELSMACILALARSIPWSDQHLKAARWERREGLELEGRTLGLVGCGKIGKLVAKMAVGFDMNVIAHDPFPDRNFHPCAGFAWLPLEEVLAKSDVVSLHCPPAANGRPLLNRDSISTMKVGAFVVNTARASLLDENAMIEALDSGKLGGLAMDVFPEEPPKDNRLPSHPKVIATPHIGGFTKESVSRAVSVAVENILAELGTAAA